MAVEGMILVHFDRQLTELEFFDAMSEVLEREGTKKFFKKGKPHAVDRSILDPESAEDTISLWVSDDGIVRWDGYCWLSWYKENGYDNYPVYTIDEFIDVFRPDLREPINFESELMALLGG